jgi:hypothetical protein
LYVPRLPSWQSVFWRRTLSSGCCSSSSTRLYTHYLFPQSGIIMYQTFHRYVLVRVHDDQFPESVHQATRQVDLAMYIAWSWGGGRHRIKCNKQARQASSPASRGLPPSAAASIFRRPSIATLPAGLTTPLLDSPVLETLLFRQHIMIDPRYPPPVTRASPTM